MKRKQKKRNNIVVVVHHIYSKIVVVIVKNRMEILANSGRPVWQEGHAIRSETEGRGSMCSVKLPWRQRNIIRDYQDVVHNRAPTVLLLVSSTVQYCTVRKIMIWIFRDFLK